MPYDVTVTIDQDGRAAVTHPDSVSSYASMRASQLSSLLILITGEGYENLMLHNEDIQQDILCLAASMAEEMEPLFEAVAFDACQRAKAEARPAEPPASKCSKKATKRGVRHD